MEFFARIGNGTNVEEVPIMRGNVSGAVVKRVELYGKFIDTAGVELVDFHTFNRVKDFE